MLKSKQPKNTEMKDNLIDFTISKEDWTIVGIKNKKNNKIITKETTRNEQTYENKEIKRSYSSVVGELTRRNSEINENYLIVDNLIDDLINDNNNNNNDLINNNNTTNNNKINTTQKTIQKTIQKTNQNNTQNNQYKVKIQK